MKDFKTMEYKYKSVTLEGINDSTVVGISEDEIKALNFDWEVVKKQAIQQYYLYLNRNFVGKKDIYKNIEFTGSQNYEFPKLTFRNLIRKLFKRPLEMELKTKNIRYSTNINVRQYYPEIAVKNKKHYVLMFPTGAKIKEI